MFRMCFKTLDPPNVYMAHCSSEESGGKGTGYRQQHSTAF